MQALSIAMAAKLKKAGHNVSTEVLAKRISESKKVMDLIRSTGGDPFTAGGRKLITGGKDTLGLAMSALAAEEMYRSGQQR